MDRGFFRSKEFLIAGSLVCALVVGGAVIGAVASNDLSVIARQGCRTPTLAGTPIPVAPTDDGPQRQGDHVTRIVHYRLDANASTGGVLDVCGSVGDITVSPSPDEHVYVTFTITNHRSGSAEAVDEVEVEAVFTQLADGVGVAAWLERGSATQEGLFGGEHTTSVHMDIEVPATGAWDVELDLDVGDITMGAVPAKGLDIRVDVGDIEARAITSSGSADVATDVGDIDLAFTSVATGRIVVSTDVGDIDIAVPLAEDIGYDVMANTDVGSVRLDIGETEHRDSDERGPSERAEARSAGFAGRAVQVTIDARTDVGSIDIEAS